MTEEAADCVAQRQELPLARLRELDIQLPDFAMSADRCGGAATAHLS